MLKTIPPDWSYYRRQALANYRHRNPARMLRYLSQLAIALLLATGLTALALLSIQNVNPVGLTFWVFRSIQLPVGLLLVFCTAGGIVVGALLPGTTRGKPRPTVPSSEELGAEFDFDDLP